MAFVVRLVRWLADRCECGHTWIAHDGVREWACRERGCRCLAYTRVRLLGGA